MQKAVDTIYDRFPMLFLRLHRGVFWNYLENNAEKFFISQEDDFPCARIDPGKNNGYMLKVLYHKNRISVEVFHTLTDGGGITEFLKSLLYYYLLFCGESVLPEDKVLLLENRFSAAEAEDGFLTYYKKSAPTEKRGVKSYRITGTHFNCFGTNTVTGYLSASGLNSYAKSKGATMTAYLTALLIYSIYEARIKYSQSNNKPVVVTIPVNLRRLFPSKTLRNFFGVINISSEVTRQTGFDALLREVSSQLHEKNTEEFLSGVIASNVKLEQNFFSRIVPLPLKAFFINCGFKLMGESKKTITLSNLGNIAVPQSFFEHIELMEALLYPTIKSPINCGACSVNDRLSISFTRTIEETDILQSFFALLSAQTGLCVTVYSNDWGAEDS